MGLTLNGAQVSGANAKIRIDGDLFTSIQSINLSEKLESAKVHGLGSSYPVGRTQGTYDASGDMEMPEQEMAQLRQALGRKNPAGYALAEFNIDIQFDNGIDPIVEIVAIDCRIAEQGSSGGLGADASKGKCGLSVMYLERDGQRMVQEAISSSGLGLEGDSVSVDIDISL